LEFGWDLELGIWDLVAARPRLRLPEQFGGSVEVVERQPRGRIRHEAADVLAGALAGFVDQVEIRPQVRSSRAVVAGEDVYAVARVEATAKDGLAMTMGIYDSGQRNGVTSRTISIEQVAGDQYQVFDLGTHELGEQMYFWAAPPKRPGEVQNVYVDRIFLIRELRIEER
jgi:hypothetical protein